MSMTESGTGPQAQSALYAESWGFVLEFIDCPRDAGWVQWREFTRPLIEGGIKAGLSRHFLAGTQLGSIVFSTGVPWGLEHHTPRVTLAQDIDEEFFLAFTYDIVDQHPPSALMAMRAAGHDLSKATKFRERLGSAYGTVPPCSKVLTRSGAVDDLKEYLSVLWGVARPGVEAPFVHR